MTIFISGLLFFVGFMAFKKAMDSTKELKRLKQRKKELTKLQERLDRAIEMETAIIQMFEDGDPYANELAQISFEEREAIELELKKLGL